MMRKAVDLLVLATLLCLPAAKAAGQHADNTSVYLLTCSPGTESYSMYGHSALRLCDTTLGLDIVYNWGVFDFSTPNFTYKFARGRLDYLLAAYSYNRFVQDYFSEERSVVSQKINLSEEHLLRLKILLSENLKEKNRFYRYDFFMDNCATRIRDILENAIGDQLVYPPQDNKRVPTYRERINEYQGGQFIWLDMGIDLLLGSPADEPCGFRESMFLPDYLMSNLSLAMVSSGTTTYPLLEQPVTVLEFDRPGMSVKIYRQPWFILSIVVLLLIFITFRIEKPWFTNLFDIILFSLLFFLAFLMIFTNYLTDHQAMGNNFNMVWLNPLLLLTPLFILLKHSLVWFWRSQIFLVVSFMILILFIKQSINPAFIPLMMLIVARSWFRLSRLTS